VDNLVLKDPKQFDYRYIDNFRKTLYNQLSKKSKEGVLGLINKIAESKAYEFWKKPPYSIVLIDSRTMHSKTVRKISALIDECQEFIVKAINGTMTDTLELIFKRLDSVLRWFIEAIEAGRNRAWLKIEHPKFMRFLANESKPESDLLLLYRETSKEIEKKAKKMNALIEEQYGTEAPYSRGLTEYPEDKMMYAAYSEIKDLCGNCQKLAKICDSLYWKTKEVMENATHYYGIQ
jgi:hypothetical protein